MENPADITGSDAADADAEAGLFYRLKAGFEKNFIREDRYKLILEGIGTTCLITALSALFGSFLAFLICMFRRTDSVLVAYFKDILKIFMLIGIAAPAECKLIAASLALFGSGHILLFQCQTPEQNDIFCLLSCTS